MTDLIKTNSDGKIASTFKVLSILDCFTPSQPELSLAQLCKILNSPKSSVLNRVRTLEECGYLARSRETGSYRLGYKILELAYCARASYPISQYAIPIMEELVSLTNEIVYLTTHIDGRIFYIECVYPNHRTTSYSIAGRTLPMHCTSCGKAMLSYMSEDSVDNIINRNGLIALTPNSITNPKELKEELNRCKLRGYAIDKEEQAPGIICVGMAIRSYEGVVAGALSISGSPISIKDSMIEEYADYLARACNSLSAYAHLFPYQELK